MITEYVSPLTDPHCIERAAELMRHNELVAFPTETVYGLGARIFSAEAVAKIFLAKGRPTDNPLIAHICTIDQVYSIAQDIPPAYFQLAEAFSPGPLTVVLPRRSTVPDIVSAGLSTVAVRMPSHPIALELIRLVGEPIVAPSANLSGKPSPTTAKHVLDDLNGKIPMIIDGGPCSVGIESTVLDISEGKNIILRPGAITKEQLELVLHAPVAVYDPHEHVGQKLASPGMKYRHYAPIAKVLLFENWDELQLTVDHSDSQTWILSQDLPPFSWPVSQLFPLNMESLFSIFRLADENKIAKIYIYAHPSIRLQLGLWNRVQRAATGK